MQKDLEFFGVCFVLINLLHGYQPRFLSKPIYVFLLTFTECKNSLNAKFVYRAVSFPLKAKKKLKKKKNKFQEQFSFAIKITPSLQ